MANDSVTLELQGEVSLARFADGVARFAELVDALSRERSSGGIRWEIADLEVGSATATARGIGADGVAPDAIELVTADYLEVGRALEAKVTVPFPAPVQTAARALAAVIGDGIEGVRFETADADAVITETPPTAAHAPAREAAYGAVTGRVQTLSSRSSLRFVIYDSVNDRPVSCYLAEGMEAKARNIWDRLATVEGWVTRDPGTGRPLSVRRVSEITVEEEVETRGYERARAARPSPPRASASRRADQAAARCRMSGHASTGMRTCWSPTWTVTPIARATRE